MTKYYYTDGYAVKKHLLSFFSLPSTIICTLKTLVGIQNLILGFLIRSLCRFLDSNHILKNIHREQIAYNIFHLDMQDNGEGVSCEIIMYFYMYYTRFCTFLTMLCFL